MIHTSQEVRDVVSKQIQTWIMIQLLVTPLNNLLPLRKLEQGELLNSSLLKNQKILNF